MTNPPPPPVSKPFFSLQRRTSPATHLRPVTGALFASENISTIPKSLSIVDPSLKNKWKQWMHPKWLSCTGLVQSSQYHQQFLMLLSLKFYLIRSISYAAVVAHADQTSRRKLAGMLVEHEPLSSKQVPLLLGIREEDTALTKAIESGDTDLVYLVLFHIWQKHVAYLLWKESWELAKNPMATRGSPLHTPRIKLIEKAQNLFAS
ncbi:unnamed protein product [Lactuca virosa]|uniref:Vps16 C-terminal domain-containing protein n=1 Tax=Lactuca virosa TaxID=75947 RepID=A0AAU9PH02_9ASTR|nr:unnamed protein product [Lactuca virosa]